MTDVSSDSSIETIPPVTSDRAVARLVFTNRHVLLTGSLLLLLPNVLFALHLKTMPAAAMLVGVLGSIALFGDLRARSGDGILARPVHALRLGVCFTVALALLVLGGEAHLAYANWDWLWRDAVLADLAHQDFPPTYQVTGESFFLRAPLGMYMVPALVAQWAGLVTGHAVLLAQNAVFLALVLYLFATLAGRRAPLAIIIFLSFSGVDVLGEILLWLMEGHALSSFVLPSHIEGWIGPFQYSSVITQLFWVPNHALPSYWLALVVLFCARDEATLGQLGVAMAAALFWSPFAFIGTLPLAIYLFARSARAVIASTEFWMSVMVALCFLPVAFYMGADAEQVPLGFVLSEPYMIVMIIIFLAVEIPHVLVVTRFWHDIEPWLRGLVAAAVAILIVLPTMHMGFSNDLVMRASIPALMILAFAFAETLTRAWQTNRVVFSAGLALALIGAVTPAQEIIRSTAFPSYKVSDCDLVTVWKKIGKNQPTLGNYLARPLRLPAWLLQPGTAEPRPDEPDRVCWPDLAYVPIGNWAKYSNTMILKAEHDHVEPRL